MSEKRLEKLKSYDFDNYSRQEISFYFCQPGYHPRSVKNIIIWSLEDYPQLRYELVEETKNEVIKKDLLEKVGENLWGRMEWLLDLSDFREEGNYRIKVSARKAQAISEIIKIDRNIYNILLEKAAKHLYLKRCGIFCHTHDAYLRSVDQEDFGKIHRQVDVSGGWHDAHDDNKWIVFVWNVIYALCDVYEKLNPKWKGANEPLPYPLAEAWWEVEWLLKMQKKDGSFYHGVFEWYPAVKDGWWVDLVHTKDCMYDDLGADARYLCDVWGSNEVNRIMGREMNTSPSTPEKYHAYLAAAISRFGRLAAVYDKNISERCIDAGQKILVWLKDRDIQPYQYIDVQCGLALTKVELYLRDKSEDLAAEISDHINEVLSLQQPEGHFHSLPTCRGLEMYSQEAGDERVFIDHPFAYVICLIRYLEVLPEGSLSGKVRQALSRFAELVKRLTCVSSFGHMPELTLAENPLLIMPVSKTCHGYNPYFLSIAYIMISLSELLNRLVYRDVGEKQIQWVLGANPRAMCFMNDEGYRNAGQYRGVASSVIPEEATYYRHNRDMRWGVTVGMYGPEKGQPQNYPNAGFSMEKKYTNKAQETWISSNGLLMLALARLAED